MVILLAVTSVLVALCHAQTCEDVNSAICQDMYAINPAICSSACYSVALCPRFCGKCPLKCYSCHEVDSPDLCYTTTQCPSADHFCIVTQGFNDDFKDVYKLGCALSSVCTAHFGPGLGRRDGSLSERSGPQGSCCSTDLCNVKSRNITIAGHPPTQQSTMMSTTGQSSFSNFPDVPRDLLDILSTARPSQTMTSVPAVTSGLCDDIDGDICTRLETHFPSMCSIDCIANEVCPRKCGKCMGCYQCNHVTNPETCTQKTICGRGEQCFSVETISTNFEQGFKLGCMDERLCSTFGHAAPGIFGKRQGFELSLHGGCCTGEFCNHHALLPTSTVPPTTSTTTVPTTTQTGCPTHLSTCPQGWLHHHSSCYSIGTPATNWGNATALCEKHCAELADFDSSSDLQSVVLDLGYHFAGLSSSGGVHVWVAGKLVHGVWQWTTTGHAAHSTLQHNTHYHNTYCGYITIVPHTGGHTVLALPSTSLHRQSCSVDFLPLCEIKHVNN
ncbi:uncharacterized protein LOC110456467 [Mizuhopecten yessoensis]|uniref:uncharacterized protein LOC110456467 n=1 Tax=Mizuhopecten yessoensis TaxID=6573 RepID=UPI000B457DFA|nr:uncharacterized protein LOC110456467 [Mizuhopecten yessoensis]